MLDRYYRKNTEKKEDDFKVDISNFKELQVYTPNGMVSFDTKGLAQVEGYGMYTRNKFDKIIKRIFSKEGVLKLATGEKIDLTMQTEVPKIIYKNEK